MSHGKMRGFSKWGVIFALGTPLLSQCSAVTNAVGAIGAAGKVTGDVENVVSFQCPSGKPDDIDKFDFQKNFELPPAVAAKLKAEFAVASEVTSLGGRLDRDLLDACQGLSADLGGPDTFTTARDACDAALRSIGDAKAKLGPGANIILRADAPPCAVDLQSYADCAGGCGLNARGGAGALQCDGQLQGSCDGVCNGECSAPEGNTGGGGSCAGTCTGSCSGSFRAPRCTGTIRPPSIDPSCKARCDAQLEAHASCLVPKVTVTISGASDSAAADRYRAALEKNVPGLAKVAQGMGPNASLIVSEATPLLSSGQSEVAEAQNATKAKLIKCIAPALTGAVSATAGIRVDLQTSAGLTAQASAGGN